MTLMKIFLGYQKEMLMLLKLTKIELALRFLFNMIWFRYLFFIFIKVKKNVFCEELHKLGKMLVLKLRLSTFAALTLNEFFFLYSF